MLLATREPFGCHVLCRNTHVLVSHFLSVVEDRTGGGVSEGNGGNTSAARTVAARDAESRLQV